MLGRLKRLDISDIVGFSLLLLIFSKKLNSLSIIVTILFVIYSIVKNKTEANKNHKSKHIFIMYFALILVSLIWTHNFEKGIKEIEKSLSLLIFPLIFLYYRVQINLKKIFHYLVVGTLSAFLFCLIYAYILAYKTGDIWTPFRYFNFTGSIGIHPGYLSMYLVVSVLFLIEQFFKSESKKKKYIYGVLIVCSFFSILYIGTKSTFFILIFVFVFYIIKQTNKKRELFKYLLLFMIALTVIGFIFYNISYGFRTRIVFLLNGKFHNLGERYEIYKGMINIIQNNPLIHFIGLGAGSSQEFLLNYYSDHNLSEHLQKGLGTHNAYFKAYLEQGFLGLIFLLILFQGLRKKYFTKDITYFLFSFAFFSFGLIEHFLDLQHGVVFFSMFNVLFYKKNNGL
ncbi:O-antigen ligase [Tenacibaculum skagerrakense]|uniref:O-antigen ligase n=1 Tax=Tenacibaculum skagerrakense TaxID=186571 RepID=A0A4R2P0F3_9FLAO|nr:O-antigen ligase family protein [Tenacibaculum skagerrakense]TCP27957.1 O-antigen ligase [Tenacibaculum skagerrakense]